MIRARLSGAVGCAALAALLGVTALGGTTTSAAAGARTPYEWVEAGWEAYRAGALGQAQHAFQMAAEEAPGWATPAVWLGAILVSRGAQADAAAWFRAALTRHPTMAEAGYASAWLARLGLAVERKQWQVGTTDGMARFVQAANPALAWPQARWVGAALRAAAAYEGVDIRLLAAVVYVESRFEHRSVSVAGAEGLGQLMPGTATGLGINPRDPWENLVGAARLLRADYEEFQSVPLTLAAYNAGSGAVRRWGGIPPYAETQWYVWAVLWIRGSLSTAS